MINWQFFPKSVACPKHLIDVVDCFVSCCDKIDSTRHKLPSDEVLAIVRPKLEQIEYQVESSKKKADKISVPVLFGRNGKLEKYFDADGFNKVTRTVIEVEAGRAVTNYQFLKDLFQACMMHDVDYLIIVVRNIYAEKNKDFDIVCTFLDTLHASDRLQLPLLGIMVIGY